MYNYKPEFIFNKKVSGCVRNIIVAEFVRKRNEVCELLNPNYEKWNAEFNALDIPNMENDPLEDYGGTEYCKFIRQKQTEVINAYEESNNRMDYGVKIRSDKTCDLYGVSEKDGIEVRVILKPY